MTEPRTYTMPDNRTWIYVQPGGCLEIGQMDMPGSANQDLVHICEEDIPRFLEELARMVREYPATI